VRTPAYFSAAKDLALRTVQWDVAGFDWKRQSAQQIGASVLDKVRAGSIILLHDGDSQDKQDRRATLAALPLIIDGLHARGLRIMPLLQLLKKTEVKLAA
jgi:peptidoglycan/xylan/chitin deacetylase (PgdA/CDA1 family)